MEAWMNAYKELGSLILAKIPEVVMVDIWNGQTEPFAEDYPYALPAVFIEFRTNSIGTIGKNVQDLDTAITFHFAVNTLKDTQISRNIDFNVPNYASWITQLHKLLQGKSGSFFSTLNRRQVYPVETEQAVRQTAMVYDSIIRDYAAEPVYTEQTIEDPKLIIMQNQAEPELPQAPLFDV